MNGFAWIKKMEFRIRLEVARFEGLGNLRGVVDGER